MPAVIESNETILIVDDEEPVRKTFREWLDGANLGCTILSAADAETALVLANEQVIDLAILDWALGAGDDGLQLLQDLAEFNPDVVAIMVTGFANKATPLDAMRMGVRDYLDKNQDLNRESFLHAVRRQLERIRPAKRERRLHQSLIAFRDAVEKIVPLVQSTAALNDPVPLSEAVRGLFRFLQQVTQAGDAVLLIRQFQANPPSERFVAYDKEGERLEVPLVPFNRSIAGSVISFQDACVMRDPERSAGGTVELQPFEKGRRCVLATPLQVAANVQAVVELFDKRGPSGDGAFSAEDQRLLQAAAALGTDLLRQALTQRQTNQVLLDAVVAALGASEHVTRSLAAPASERLEQPPPPAVLERLREGLQTTGSAAVDAGASLRLAEAIRVLAVRHGSPAVEHCVRLVESLRELLDRVGGA